jgi:poly-beta-1,6-N-acetyl-D-glucosamine N-deacetylase
MITKKKRLLLKLIRFSGLHLFFRYLQKNRVTIIFYHDIDQESFEKQIKYLIRYYNIISLNTLADFLYKKNVKLPPRSVMITFDDGHAGNFKLLEIIKQFQIKPTIFLTTNLIGSTRPLWFNLSLKGDKFIYLRSVTNNERLEYLKNNYNKELNIPVKHCLSWSEVIEMSEFVDFQSHTLEHPFLPQCTKEEMKEEVVKSKTIIEDKLRKDVFAIAYPNGDYSPLVIDTVKHSNYILGFTTVPEYVNKQTNPFTLSRFSMNDTDDINDFILRHTGTWFFLRKASLNLKHPWKIFTK